MSEKPDDVGLDSKPRAERDRIELAHEMVGGNAGRIQRFSISDNFNASGENSKEKKAEREYRFMLHMLLAEDAQYAQLYHDVQDKLNMAYQAVGQVLVDIKQHLLDSDQSLENFRNQTAELEDGTKVFMSSDGSIYTEDGQRLDRERADKIIIPKEAPSWEDYRGEQGKRAALLRDRQQLEMYKDHTLDDLYHRMKDKDNPPTIDVLEDWKENFPEFPRLESKSINVPIEENSKPPSVSNPIDDKAFKANQNMGADFEKAHDGILDLSELEAVPSQKILPPVPS